MFKFKSTMIIKLIGVIISYKKCKTEFKNSCMRRAMGDSSNQFTIRRAEQETQESGRRGEREGGK